MTTFTSPVRSSLVNADIEMMSPDYAVLLAHAGVARRLAR